MITLHILQHLADNGFGTLDTDLHWEKLPTDKYGIAIISRDGETHRGRWAVQSFDLYSRGQNDLTGADKLEKIWEFISDEGIVCDLPPVTGKSTKSYRGVRIWPVGNLENLGLDETDRLLWRWSYQVSYLK